MRIRNVFSLCGYSFLAASLMTASATAQQLPPQADPGQIQRRFEKREEIKPTPKPVIQTPALPSTSAADSGITLTLQSVDVQGVTIYNTSEIEAFYAGKLGQKTTLGEVQAIANAITLKYRADGYVLSQAVLPAQKIDDGRVTIQVVEGYVENVVVEGEPSKRKLIERYTSKIEGNRPLNINTLERYLLLANDLPGISALAVLRPSATTVGAADVVITVQEDKFEGSVGVDNRGTDFIGPVQFTTMLTGNNLLGLYDRTTVRSVMASDTNELRFFDLHHEEQIGSEGTKLLGVVSYSDTEPGSTLDELDVEGTSFAFSMGASHPFLRTRNENLTLRGNFDFRDTQTDILGLDFSEDKIRALRVGVEYDRGDSWNGVNLVSLGLSQGLDFWNATGPGIMRSRADGEEDFTKMNMDLSRLQTIDDNWSVLASATGQYSWDPLLSAEEFTVGGAAFGQAYDPSELAGDHGAAARLELRYSRYAGLEYFKSYQAYSYYDLGAVWQEESQITTSSDRNSLASAGLGLRFNLTDTVSGDTQVGFPLTRDVATNGNQSPNVYFRLTKLF